MEQQILEISQSDWHSAIDNKTWIASLEAGKVLYFSQMPFTLLSSEQCFLTPAISAPKSHNISLDTEGRLTGAAGDAQTQAALAAMIARFRSQAQMLVHSLLPRYSEALRVAPTSYHPAQVETKALSRRADDKRMHLDTLRSRPNYGERVLRVFTNINPHGVPRVWRVGEPFDVVARRFLPQAKPYSHWQAKLLKALRITKSLRSEYDHLMLQLDDGMKGDLAYQKEAEQVTVPFPSGCVWVCFSDQTSHAVMSGQYMMEQTFHLPVAQQYDINASPLAILTRMTGRTLI